MRKPAIATRIARAALCAPAMAALILLAACESGTAPETAPPAESQPVPPVAAPNTPAGSASAGQGESASKRGDDLQAPSSADTTGSGTTKDGKTLAPDANQAPAPDVAALPPPAEPLPPPPPPEPQVNADPQRLVGLDQSQLTDLLGTPAFLRHDPPAQLWRYRGEDCRIDLFLYRDGAADVSRYVVRHYAVLSGGKPTGEPQECLKGMLLARMAKRPG